MSLSFSCNLDILGIMRHFGRERGTSPCYCQVQLDIQVLYFAPINTPEGCLAPPGQEWEFRLHQEWEGCLLPPGGLKVSAPHSACVAGCGGGAAIVVFGRSAIVIV